MVFVIDFTFKGFVKVCFHDLVEDQKDDECPKFKVCIDVDGS